MCIFEYLKVLDIILSLFLHKNLTGLILLARTVVRFKTEKGRPSSNIEVRLHVTNSIKTLKKY